MKRIYKLLTAASIAGAAAVTTPAFAQPAGDYGPVPRMMGGYGPGGGPGMWGYGGEEGPGCGPGYGPCPGYGPGPGYGPDYGPGPAYGGPGMMWRYGPGYGPGMMRGYGPGYGMGPGMMWGYGQGPGGYSPFSALNLSDDQRTKIAKIIEDLHRKQWDLMGKMREQSWRNVDPNDDTALEKQYRDLQSLRQQMFENSLAARKQIRELLTKEQREQLKRYPGGWWVD